MAVNGVKKSTRKKNSTSNNKRKNTCTYKTIIEELGGAVDWDGVERKVTIKFKNKTMKHG